VKKKNQLDINFVFFISTLIVAQHAQQPQPLPLSLLLVPTLPKQLLIVRGEGLGSILAG